MDDIMGKIQEVLSDEESMKQLSELASALFSSSENSGTENQCGKSEETDTGDSGGSGGFDFDISKILMMGQLMNSASDDKNARLLLALKPLLKEERQAKVDKALKLLRLLAIWNVLKESGMLGDIF